MYKLGSSIQLISVSLSPAKSVFLNGDEWLPKAHNTCCTRPFTLYDLSKIRSYLTQWNISKQSEMQQHVWSSASQMQLTSLNFSLPSFSSLLLLTFQSQMLAEWLQAQRQSTCTPSLSLLIHYHLRMNKHSEAGNLHQNCVALESGGAWKWVMRELFQRPRFDPLRMGLWLIPMCVWTKASAKWTITETHSNLLSM